MSPAEVVVATSVEARWYQAFAILSGGFVVTAAAAVRARYRPKLSLRGKPLIARTVVQAEAWLTSAVLIIPAVLALGGHYGIGKDIGTAWGRLLPSVGILSIIINFVPIEKHPSWKEAERIGPLRTCFQSISVIWIVLGIFLATGWLVLMGVLKTWDALAANIVAYFIALLYPYRPDLKAHPSRIAEDVGDGMLLLPGLFGPVSAYALDHKKDILILVIVPNDSPKSLSRESLVDLSPRLKDGLGKLEVAEETTRPFLIRHNERLDRKQFPSDLRLPFWDELSDIEIALQIMRMAKKEANCHSLHWANDRHRAKERWSLRAMMLGLMKYSTQLSQILLDGLNPSLEGDRNSTSVQEESLFDRLFALGTIGLMLTELEGEAKIENEADAESLYWEWSTERSYLENVLTLPCKVTSDDARRTAVSALEILQNIYMNTDAANSYYLLRNLEERVGDNTLLQLTLSKEDSSCLSQNTENTDDNILVPASDDVQVNGEEENDKGNTKCEAVKTKRTPKGCCSSASTSLSAVDGADDIPWPFVASVFLLRRCEDRTMWGGDCEPLRHEFSVYSAEFIRRYVSRGLLLVQATTFAYALAGAVVTELLG
eukprot:Plantae.Rhodophyta-Hildenbrandia_rubra.ctg39237.p1 GENE.Plantae.Rhodophyta-Hildenbrandia_rubra.ctg39237~~Plantae.Rhodophyta-Hildenbrandia_rubra.ctg39237.p1  ORF type:complete len:601 (+),score=76.22 Plantae.Rhodophyta-Hildenbrandia_rubra.ctg39237:299-2101(+)